MAEGTQGTPEARGKEDDVKVRPTLFIAVGGTGMEILMRVRHRILTATWGSKVAPVRVSSLSEFPVAQFLHMDLDMQGADKAGDQARQTDIFAAQKAFTEDEKVVQTLDSNKYYQTNSSLDQYPHIQKWMPLTRAKFIEAKIDPGTGAGQIRSLSRLYFYDKYPAIRNVTRNKITRLLSGISNEDSLNRLALETEKTLRIVIVCSSAGGTGSGSFLDMGYLAKILSEETGVKAAIDLFMLLPGGYAGHGKSRTEANGYGALMELETAMSQDVKFVESWERNVTVQQPMRPFDNVYLFDTANVVNERTAEVSDVYDMVSDSLFEDFQSENFGKRKRSIAPNAAQYKAGGFTPPASEEYKELNLSYSNTTSMLGQFTIDTHLDQSKNVVVARRVNTMLETFFGIASHDIDANKPTELERDAVMAERMSLGAKMFTLKYTYAGTAHPDFADGTEKQIPAIVDELLRDVSGKSLVDEVTAKVHSEVQKIKNAGQRDQWPVQINDLKRQLERDAFKKVETGTGMREEVIAQRRVQLLAQLTANDSGLVKALWDLVDNNERGGINYTKELIESIKDRIENAETGLLSRLSERAKWFDDLSGKINSDEIRTLEEHLGQLRGNFSLFGNKQSQAETKLDQLSEAMAVWIVSHLRAVACREAHALLVDLSSWLGNKTGYDAKSDEEIWRGFIGKLMDGRKQVKEVMALMSTEIAMTEVAMKSEHATYVVIPAPPAVLNSLSKEAPAAETRVWAAETFKKYGGKRELFARLGSPDGRAELIAELRSMALRKLPYEIMNPQENPLFDALRKAPDREALFRKCLRRSMPWVDANLNGQFTANADQYSCVIGVGNAKEFEREFGEEFRRATPTEGGFNASKIYFLESGIPGKLTCYIEFSGLPLTTLRQLRNWRVSYDEQNKKVPVHTTNKKSMFVHPLHPSPDEVKRLEEDFRIFLQAIAVGVLRRRSAEDSYEIKRKGVRLSIGMERLVRLEGIDPEYRDEVQNQLNAQLDAARSAVQLCALAVLFETYAENTYTSRVVRVDERDRTVSGMGHFICTKLYKDYERKYQVRASAEKLADVSGLAARLRSRINEWSELVEGSEEDGYRNEVAEDAGPKRTVRPEFFESGWIERLIDVSGNVGHHAEGAFAPAGKFYVALNGMTVGPYDLNELVGMIAARTVNAQTLLCKVGAQQWLPAATVPEVGPLFAVAPPPPPPQPLFTGLAGGPPPHSGVPAPTMAAYFAVLGGQQSGPFNLLALQEMVAGGRFDRNTPVWKEGMGSWQKAAEVAELGSLFGPATTPPYFQG